MSDSRRNSRQNCHRNVFDGLSVGADEAGLVEEYLGAHDLSDNTHEAIRNDLSAKSAQTVNWRTSIVDLMKLLGLDSSLAERKGLAQEFGYTGALDGSAEMNIWLHKQVMRELAANGGKVPAELLS